MITAPDDDLVRTHDEARALLSYAIPGATLRVWRLPEMDSAHDRGRGYELSIARDGGTSGVLAWGAYALPTRASKLVAAAIDQARKANP